MTRRYESLVDYIYAIYKEQISKALLAYFASIGRYINQEEADNPEQYGLETVFNWIITSIHYFKAPNYDLDFDMAIKMHLEVTDYVGDDLETNVFEGTYTLRMSAVLHHGLKNLTIEKILDGYQCREYSKDNSLSEFLTPYIGKNDYERYAYDFLKLYFPRALETPCSVSPLIVIKNMGLNVMFSPMQTGINGEIIFSKKKVQRYNFDKDILETVIAPSGTILLNSDLLSKEKFGSLNNTVIHECIHWWLHRKYFELQTLLNPDDFSSVTYVDEMEMPDEKKFKNKYFMELQARTIAPMVLMPETQIRKMYEQVRDKLERRKSYHSKKKTYFNAIYKIADFFGASPTSSRIRIENLGYTEVAFIKKLDSLQEIKPFKSSVHLKPGQSYIVEFAEAVKALGKNPELNKELNDGHILYVDGLFVVNDPTYVKRFKNGNMRLTNLALADVSKCCLLFCTEAESVTVNYDPAKFNFVTFCSGGSKNDTKRSVSIRTIDNEKVLKLKRKAQQQVDELNDAQDVISHMNEFSFLYEKLNYLMTSGIVCDVKSDSAIAKRTGISDKTIKKMRVGESTPDEKQLLAICSGLKLHPYISKYLFKCARLDIFSTNEEPFPFYVVLLNTCYKAGRDAWNVMIHEAYPKALNYSI